MQYIPQIKQTLDAPDTIYQIARENKFIFAKSYRVNTVLVSAGHVERVLASY